VSDLTWVSFLAEVLLFYSNLNVDNVLILVFEAFFELAELPLILLDFLHVTEEVFVLDFVSAVTNEVSQVAVQLQH